MNNNEQDNRTGFSFQLSQASDAAPLPSPKRVLTPPCRSSLRHSGSRFKNLLSKHCDTMASGRTEERFRHSEAHSLVTQRDTIPSNPWPPDQYLPVQHGNVKEQANPALHTAEAHCDIHQNAKNLLPCAAHLAPKQRNIWIYEDVQDLGNSRPSKHHLSCPQTPSRRSDAEAVSRWHRFKTLWTGEDSGSRQNTNSRKRHASPATSVPQPPILGHSHASSPSMESLVNEDSHMHGKDTRQKRHESILTQPAFYDRSDTSPPLKDLEVAENWTSEAVSGRSARRLSASRISGRAGQPSSLSRGGDVGQLGLKNPLLLPEDFQPSPAASNRGAFDDQTSISLSIFSVGFQKPNTSKWETFLEASDKPEPVSMRFSTPKTSSPNLWKRDWRRDKPAVTDKLSFSASKVLDSKISSPFAYRAWSHSDSETKSLISQNLRGDEILKESSLMPESRMLLLQPFITTQSFLSQHAAG